ncbi:hypothetical protein ACWDX6_06545 [Streptomyces sp. NPDC003027]
MDLSLWLLLACVSACSLVTTFASSARTGMPRHDTQELRRRQHLIHVLEANARLVRREGEKAVGFAFVAPVESAAAGEPGHGAFDGQVVATQSLRPEKRRGAAAPTGRTTRTATAAAAR